MELQAPARGRRPLPGGDDPRARRVHPAGGSRRHRAAPRRGAVRLHARRRAVRPCGARRQRLHPVRHRLRRADRRAGAAARTAPTGSSAAPIAASRPRCARILASLVRRETRVGSAPHGAATWCGSSTGDVPMLDQPGAARRVRRAEGRRHPERAGGDGLHVQPAATRPRCAGPATAARVAVAMKRAVDGLFRGDRPYGGHCSRRMDGWLAHQRAGWPSGRRIICPHP